MIAKWIHDHATAMQLLWILWVIFVVAAAIWLALPEKPTFGGMMSSLWQNFCIPVAPLAVVLVLIFGPQLIIGYFIEVGKEAERHDH